MSDADMDCLGVFAKPHVDGNDHPGALTAMLSCGKKPEWFRMGTFHLFELGFFVVLSHVFCALFFSGLRLHGGCAPSCPSGEQWVTWATRLVFVLYPAAHILNNFSITALASQDPRTRNAEQEACAALDKLAAEAKEKQDRGELVENDVFEAVAGREAINVQEEKRFEVKYANMIKMPSSIKSKYVIFLIIVYGVIVDFATSPQNELVSFLETHATFAQDGHVIMSRRAWLTFVVRNWYILLIGTLCQTSPLSGVRIHILLGVFSNAS